MTETALEDVAAVADRVADDQRQVARRARSMRRRREQGSSWSAVLDKERSPGLVESIRGSARALSTEATRLAVFLAKKLSAEGETRRQIAGRLGVSHQRVTTLLGGDRNTGS